MVSCSICQGKEKPLHHMPNPGKYLPRFQQWVQATRNPRLKNLTNCQIFKRGFVCYKHFTPEDYVPGTHKLHNTAIPTVNLPQVIDMEAGMEASTVSCCVFGCGGRVRPMYRFPNPNKSMGRFSKWVDAVQNPRYKDLTPVAIHQRGYVCHKHFSAEDFVPSGRKLYPTAVPTLNLPPKNTPDDATLERQMKDFSECTLNPEISGFSAIDMSKDDLGPQLVEDFELLQNLPSFDAKLVNIDDFKTSFYNPFCTGFPSVYNENDMNDLRHSTFDREGQGELSVIQKNISTDDHNADNYILGEVGLRQPTAESVENDNDENLNEASFSTGKPYFKSVKCYIPDCNSLKEVCRICFRSLTKEEEVIKLYGKEISMKDKIQIKNMLKLVLPDMDLEMYPNIVICTKCTELLAYSYQLKEMWLSTEAKLQKILEKKKAVIRRDADLVIIKKEVKNKTLPDIEHNYADTSMDLKEETSEELKIAGSILENLLTTDNDDSLKTVKLFHGELSMAGSNSSKPVHSQKSIKKNIWGLGPYMCEQCGQIYTHSTQLRRHLLSHREKVKKPRQKERKIMCEICGKLCLTSGSLKSHRRIHSEPKCPTCGKQFEHIKALNRHVFCAHRRRSFQCHLCGKQYPYATSLRNHLILHNPKKKVHACDICDKKFFVPSRLRKHLRTHVTDRLWSCNYCGKTVKYEHSLQRHIRIYHMNQAEFVCEFCNRPYWKKVDLLKHRIRIHGCSMDTGKLQEDSLLENEADFCSAVQIGVQECEI